MIEVGLGALVFTVIVMGLAWIVLVARRFLVVQGEVDVRVNERMHLRVPMGSKLLGVLLENGLRIPSACGGSGTCGLCRVTLEEGGGDPGPVEVAQLSAADLRSGVRFACQVALREDIAVRLPDTVVGAEEIECSVRSTRNVSTFIKEIELALPAGQRLDFHAGAFVQVTCPPYRVRFSDLRIDPPFEAEWELHGLRNLEASAAAPTTRAYSLANPPADAEIALLNVRIATPPPSAPPGTPPGVVSSWLFGLSPGDPVTIAGPFGHFRAMQTEREMIFVGGGAGMAPMRSHIFDQLERLHTQRKLTFWYGARSRRELFYVEDFDRLQQEHENFRWSIALSDPKPSPEGDDPWSGHVGFIHQVLFDQYLAHHPAPEECEYYLCGPPMMIRETRRLLERLGVAGEDIHYDDFGG